MHELAELRHHSAPADRAHHSPAANTDSAAPAASAHTGALAAYMPQDRRRALAHGTPLPAQAWGAVLFADLTGFTPLTERLVATFGRRQGVDALLRLLNRVYPPLIDAVERAGGSVIGFSGDAITCWFGAQTPGEQNARTLQRALVAAGAMQRAMASLAVTLGQEAQTQPQAGATASGATASGATDPSPTATAPELRVTITCGDVLRTQVGDPAHARMDTLAGAPVDRVAIGDALARRGEVVLDAPGWSLLAAMPPAPLPLPEEAAWRGQGDARFAPVPADKLLADPFGYETGAAAGVDLPTLDAAALDAAAEWVLPALRAAIASGHEEFSAELRPAAALFVRFSGIDYARGSLASAQLDRYVRWVQQEVARYEGALIQVTTGDKGAYLYAAFGAPVAHDDDIARALLAAAAIAAPPAELAFIDATQVGVSHGLMRVGAYGGPSRRTYGVQGDAVNTAARLMAAAAPGEILATEAVAAAAREQVRTRGAAAFPIEVSAYGTRSLKGAAAATYYRVRPRTQTPDSADHGTSVGRSPAHARPADTSASDTSASDTGAGDASAGDAGASDTGMPHGRPIADRGRFAAPLMGRAAELAQIAASLAEVGASPADESAPAHAGRLIVLEGPAGIGKSHLLNEAVAQARRVGWMPLAAASHSTTQHTPFAAARQFVAALLGWDPTAPDAQSHPARLIGALQKWVADAALRAPLLNDLLGLTLPESDLTRTLEARTRQEALIALLLDLIQQRAAVSRLLFVLEDSHWLDEGSARILGALLAMLEHAPVVAITTVRPRGLPASIQTQPALTLHLTIGDLPNDAAESLLTRRLGAPLSPLAAAVILTQSQGNPFFAEEFTDALVEAGSLVRSDSHDAATPARWTLAEATVRALRGANCVEGEGDDLQLRRDAPLTDANLGVPNSIQGIILARLDRLPDAARLMLKVASVVGRTFSTALLAQVRLLANQRSALDNCVEVALQRDFVRVADAPALDPAPAPASESASAPVRPVLLYFRHNLIREVAYNTLLDAQQKELHGQVGAALEIVQPDATEELANHYARGDTTQPAVRQRAVAYLTAAARHAQSEYANETALAFYQRVLALQADPALLAGCSEVLHVLGRREEQALLLNRLAASPTADTFEVARLWVDYYEALGEYETAQQWLRRALTLARSERAVAHEARVLVKQGMILWRQGEFDAARLALDAALQIAGSVPASPASSDPASSDPASAQLASAEADALYGLGLLNRQQGRLEEAQQCFADDLALRQRAANPERAARALNAIGNVRAMLRDSAGALDYYQRALAIRRRIGDRAGVGSSLLAIAQCYSSQARLAEAEPMLREALRIQRAIRNRFQESLAGNELGILQWLIGQYAEAEATLLDALAIAEALDSDMLKAYLLCNLGQVQRDAVLARPAAATPPGSAARATMQDPAALDAGTLGTPVRHAAAGAPESAVATLERGLAMALAQEDTALAAIYQSDLALALHLAGDPARALALVSEAEASCRALEQERDLTTVLPTRARILLALGRRDEAARAAAETIARLDAAGVDPHEFAHRDYYYSGEVLATCGDHAAAAHAFAAARRLLLARAERITNAEFKRSFLENVAHNRAILTHRWTG